MIRFDQSLQIRRLVILKSGGAIYDEVFHPGVNIIRGENSTGKSTIADFIFFVLGGEITEWSPEAGAAESVHAEVLLGGKVLSLARDVEQDAKPPMYIYEGNLQDAMANRGDWLKFPPIRSSNSESFSQVLFRFLKLPEQKTDAQQNITMHQALRLLYCDQMTPVDQIFRQEQFDTKDIRLAVSELLLGLDDLALHDLRLAIRVTDRAYGELIGELKSIFSILGQTADSGVALADMNEELRQLSDERVSLEKQVEMLRTRRDASTRSHAEARRGEVVTQAMESSEALSRARDRERELSLDVVDSQRFIETLNERIQALDSSAGVAAILGGVSFTVCPACLTPIDAIDDEVICHLCKSKLPESARWGHLKMREELSFQLKESTKLLADKTDELRGLRERIARLQLERNKLASEAREFERQIDPIDAEVSALQKRLGYLDRSMEDAIRKNELSSIVKGKMQHRDALLERLNSFRSQLEASESHRLQRRNNVTFKIVQLCIEGLHRDLPMEEGFQDAKVVQFDFGQNKLLVDNRTKFSASSATYLKNVFLFSLFELSLQDSAVRWPRFILLDNIEDKGMQPKRSGNFQKYVVEKSMTYEVEHQVIMTTSMITAELEDSELCVGPHYTEYKKSLNFKTASSSLTD